MKVEINVWMVSAIRKRKSSDQKERTQEKVKTSNAVFSPWKKPGRIEVEKKLKRTEKKTRIKWKEEIQEFEQEKWFY